MEALQSEINDIDDINDIRTLIKTLKRRKEYLKENKKNKDNDGKNDALSSKLHDPSQMDKIDEEDTRIKDIIFLERNMDMILLVCVQGNERCAGIISVSLNDFKKLTSKILKADNNDTVKFKKYENHNKTAVKGKGGKWTIKS